MINLLKPEWTRCNFLTLDRHHPPKLRCIGHVEVALVAPPQAEGFRVWGLRVPT